MTDTGDGESHDVRTRVASLAAELHRLAERRHEACAVLGESLYEATKEDPRLREGREALFGRVEEIDSQRKAIEQQLAEAKLAEEAANKPVRTCSNCGAPLRDGDRFCSKCGHPVEDLGTSADKPKTQAPELTTDTQEQEHLAERAPDEADPAQELTVVMGKPADGKEGLPSGEGSTGNVPPHHDEGLDATMPMPIIRQARPAPQPSAKRSAKARPARSRHPRTTKSQDPAPSESQDSNQHHEPYRFCPVCGSRVEPTYKFCLHCGARLQ